MVRNVLVVQILMFFAGMPVNVRIKTSMNELLNLKMALYCYSRLYRTNLDGFFCLLLAPLHSLQSKCLT